MKVLNQQNAKYIKILLRVVAVFWIIVGIMYLIGGEFGYAIAEIVAGIFFILLSNLFKKYEFKD